MDKGRSEKTSETEGMKKKTRAVTAEVIDLDGSTYQVIEEAIY